ncbi:MAG TPA: glycerophosphodiester phosphodiesterase family protein [Nitrospiraceae bacterium]|nr:glycerophosphodiester phosphodiesterase family protein [Nitrospiraceae bacterium]
MHRVLRIGHRGAAGHAPENTLAAIQKGIGLGVDFVEIDVRRTADGVLVVLHDETVNRTTNGTGRVAQLSLADLKKFDAGSGESIPTLEEVLKAIAGRAGLMLELKMKGTAQRAVEVVHEAGFRDPVIYASFLHDELSPVRVVDPGASLMVLFGRLPKDPVSSAMAHGPSHVGLRHDTATRRLVEDLHRAGLLVFVYTADSPGDIEHALSLGVDGVISNFPERIAGR